MKRRGPVGSDDDPPTVQALLRAGAKTLPNRRGIPDPYREAMWLLAAACDRSETWLRIHPESFIAEEAVAQYTSWIARRRDGEPAEHLIGACEFWGRSFRVCPDVLIPRPESELLIDAALQFSLPEAARVLDIGCGSGCLAVTLAAERPDWQVAAVDRSVRALLTARMNGAAHHVDVAWVLGDLDTAVAPGADLIVANLPYLPNSWLRNLPIEVLREPSSALDGGEDGLDLVRRLLADLPRVLSAGGRCLFELAEDQANTVRSLAREHDLEPYGSWTDAGGCERIVAVRKG